MAIDGVDMFPIGLNIFETSFLTALLGSETDGEDRHLDDRYAVEDIHPSTRAGLREQCERFVDSNLADLRAAVETLGYSWDMAGYDFAFSRNGHGVGYSDRSLGEAGNRLQAAAEAAGPAEAYAGDDGKIYVVGLEKYAQAPSNTQAPADLIPERFRNCEVPGPTKPRLR